MRVAACCCALAQSDSQAVTASWAAFSSATRRLAATWRCFAWMTVAAWCLGLSPWCANPARGLPDLLSTLDSALVGLPKGEPPVCGEAIAASTGASHATVGGVLVVARTAPVLPGMWAVDGFVVVPITAHVPGTSSLLLVECRTRAMIRDAKYHPFAAAYSRGASGGDGGDCTVVPLERSGSRGARSSATGVARDTVRRHRSRDGTPVGDCCFVSWTPPVPGGYQLPTKQCCALCLRGGYGFL